MAVSVDLKNEHEVTLTNEIVDANPNLPAGVTVNDFNFRNMTPVSEYGVTIDVDLLIEPSEVYGDYVKFSYDRIPLPSVFSNLDYDLGTTEIEVKYNPGDDAIIAADITNFRDIFDTWYRFSHHTSYPTYPAIAAEVDSWIYIDDIDTIECTMNTSSTIGFMSSGKTTDFDFNTVVSAYHTDDDYINVIGLALQHDVDTVRDENISVSINTGGNGGGQIVLRRNFADVGSSVIQVMNPYQPPVDPNNQWSRYPWTKVYGHVVMKRRGNMLYAWAIVKDLPAEALVDQAAHNEGLKAVVRRVRGYTETDFEHENYFYAEYDLTGTPFADVPCRFGYSAQSQPAARFWNIQRPGESTTLSPEFKNYFLNRFGFNIGNDGVKVSDYGQNQYKVTVDNLLYKGEVIMVP